MTQTALLPIITILFVVEFYEVVMMINNNMIHSVYKETIEILTVFAWALSSILKIIALNYVSNGICIKVYTHILV